MPRLLLNAWPLAFLLLAIVVPLSESYQTDPVERKDPIIIPLNHGYFPASKHTRGRNLIGEARMWLYGHILTRGYYYANLWLGTPPQFFSLIVDTGSTVTYVPCSTCTHCGVHQDTPYSSASSSSFLPISCRSDSCPGHLCDSLQKCIYRRRYAENSTSNGVLVSDLASFGNTSSINGSRITFGCETEETGDLYSQRADGIIGLGRGVLSIVDQLVAGSVTENVFSLCYGGMDNGGGSMVLGKVELPEGVVYTPMDPARMHTSAYYNLIVQELQLNGEKLIIPPYAFEQGYGTVLDSGTTFCYLPKLVFRALLISFKNKIPSLHSVDAPDPRYPDICFGGASLGTEGLSKYFPTIDFVLGSGSVYHLSPENYLFRHHKIDGAYCLGFFENTDPGTLLGAIFVRNTLVTYDRESLRIGFLKADCSDPSSLFPSASTNSTPPEDSDSALGPSLAPQLSPIPAPPPRGSQSPTCELEDCVAEIDFVLRVGTEYSLFSGVASDFFASLARILDVGSGQLELVEFLDVSPAGTEASFKLKPVPSWQYIPQATLDKVKATLNGNLSSEFSDSFGGINLKSIIFVKYSKPGWKIPIWLWLTIALGAIALISAAVAGLLWWRYRNNPLKYLTISRSTIQEIDEETTALGDGDL